MSFDRWLELRGFTMLERRALIGAWQLRFPNRGIEYFVLPEWVGIPVGDMLAQHGCGQQTMERLRKRLPKIGLKLIFDPYRIDGVIVRDDEQVAPPLAPAVENAEHALAMAEWC